MSASPSSGTANPSAHKPVGANAPGSNFSGPKLDPTPFFDLVRGNLATELLCSGVNHLQIPKKLAKGPKPAEALREEIGLAPRAWVVLSCALKAMNIIVERGGLVELTPQGMEFLTEGEFDMQGYMGLVAQTPGVLALLERLTGNKPAANRADEGDAFIFREGKASAMDDEAAARRLTLALSGRARICGPALSQVVAGSGKKRILDVGGGSGLYAIAILKADPLVRATVWDRAAVLKVAADFARRYGVESRLDLVEGDMFRDPVPEGHDGFLLSNILHDWDFPECHQLLRRLHKAGVKGAALWVHDVFLNEELDGPLSLALYSTALFTLTEGRAYSAGEYRAMLRGNGFADLPGIVETAVHCGVISAEAV